MSCNAVNGMTGPVTLTQIGELGGRNTMLQCRKRHDWSCNWKAIQHHIPQGIRCNAVNGMTGPVTAGSQNPHKYRGYRGHFSAPPAKNGQNAVILVGHCFENCLRISVFIKEIKAHDVLQNHSPPPPILGLPDILNFYSYYTIYRLIWQRFCTEKTARHRCQTVTRSRIPFPHSPSEISGI